MLALEVGAARCCSIATRCSRGRAADLVGRAGRAGWPSEHGPRRSGRRRLPRRVPRREVRQLARRRIWSASSTHDRDRAAAVVGEPRSARRRSSTQSALFGRHRLRQHRGADAGALRCAAALLAHGVDVLVEKPITAHARRGRRLVELLPRRARPHPASRPSRALQSGRSARWPASSPEPRFIECHRLAPFTERGTEVDVILDLMIHDLDVILSVVRRRRSSGVEAVGVPVLSENRRHRQRAPALRQRRDRQRHAPAAWR